MVILMKKRKEKKYKIKFKLLAIIPFIILVVGFAILNNYNNQLKIKSHYNKYVKVIKNTKLYNKNLKEIGTISKNFSLELSSNKSTNYFNIKNTPYYIYYEDVKKDKKTDTNNDTSYYVNLDKTIKSKNLSLMEDDKVQITLKNSLNFDVYYEDSDYYYVYFQNKLLKVKKDDSIKESTNEIKDKANHISILYYEMISDNCNDYNCTTTTVFKEEMNKLKENGYYTITEQDYERYLDHFINLKDKAILVTTSLKEEEIASLKEELKINIISTKNEGNIRYLSTFKTTNKDTPKNEANRYQIKSYTTIDDILKMAAGEELRQVLDEESNQKIAVLNYHFFFDKAGGEECNETICLDTAKFREHLQYLKDNNYNTLTMNEFKRWMYGEIELPSKSVLITIDDGAMGTGRHNGNKLIPLLEEYKMHATLFLIAGWWDIENYRSPYLDIQSHTYDMHQYGSCGRGQLNCATYEQAKEDLQKSIDIIGNTDSFCFPFYMYSDTSLRAIKDVGFQIAFVGGMRKASRSSNKYLIPRYPIHSAITLNDFISYVS